MDCGAPVSNTAVWLLAFPWTIPWICLNLMGRASVLLVAPLLHKGSRGFRHGRILQKIFPPSFTIFFNFTILACNALYKLWTCDEKMRQCTINQATETKKRTLVRSLINKKRNNYPNKLRKCVTGQGQLFTGDGEKQPRNVSTTKCKVKNKTSWALDKP